MTSIVLSSDLEIVHIMDSITSWLDKVFATKYTNHRRLLELEDDLRMVDDEISEIERYYPGAFEPAAEVAAHRLGLRYRDLQGVILAKWRSPDVRRSSLLALRGIHERYVGHVPSGLEQPTIFEISRTFHNPDFGGFIEAHSLEPDARCWVSGDLFSRALSLYVVEGPAWVRDLYWHLSGTSLRGERLREHYLRGNSYDWRRENHDGHFVGSAIPAPEPDILEAALQLWAPDVEDSPYARLGDAVEAARLL